MLTLQQTKIKKDFEKKYQSNPNTAIYDLIVALTTNFLNDIKKGVDIKPFLPIKGIHYFDGKPGRTPVKGVDYTDGKPGRTPKRGVDYWTAKDREDILRTVLKSALMKKPKDGKPGKEGKTPVRGIDYFTQQDIDSITNQAVNIIMPFFTGDYIVKEINKLEITPDKQIDFKHIKGLSDKRAGEKLGGIHRGGGDIILVDDLSDFTDGSTKVFTLSRKPKGINKMLVWGSDFPMILRPTVDFTISNTSLTLTSQVNAPSQGATLIVQYVI